MTKFSCTFNFVLLATLAVMDTFFNGYNRKNMMKLVRVKTMIIVQAEKRDVKKLNAEKTIQNTCPLDFRY
jgi:hypothetical protein